MKKNFGIVLALLLSIGLLTACGKKEEEVKPEPVIIENTSEGIIKDREVDGISVTNTSMKTVDGLTKLEVTLTNNGSSDYQLNEYKIIVKDKDGNVIKEMPGYVGSVIKAGASKILKASTNADMSNASSIDYEVIK